MKKLSLLLILAICLIFVPLYGAEESAEINSESKADMQNADNARTPPETLIDVFDVTHSGYGAPLLKFTRLNDEYSILAGGQAGWIMNDVFVIGIGGFGLATRHEREDILNKDDPEDLRFTMGYGGMIIEYYFFPKKLILFSAGALIGAGRYALYSNDDNDGNMNGNGRHMDWVGDEVFFVVEPALNLYINITRFMRIGAGVSYRLVNGVNSYGFENSDLGGYSVQIMTQFGWF